MTYERTQLIEEQYKKGPEPIEQGKIRSALRLKNRLTGIWPGSESIRAETILEGYSLLVRRKPSTAKRRCLERMYYLWNNPDGLFVIRQANGEISEKSRLFDITVLGGCATLGAFVAFTEKHSCTFQAVADSREEAFGFIAEVANFQEEPKAMVVTFEALQSDDNVDRKGVYSCSHFSLTGDCDDELPQRRVA